MKQQLAPVEEIEDENDGIDLLDLALLILQHWRLLVVGPLLAGVVALGTTTYLIKPTFTARTVFLPPQQQQSANASALASLGALSGFVGAATGVKSPADQYVALLQSTTVLDRLVDQFNLMQVYGESFRQEARKHLSARVTAVLGKKDGLITVEVDDEDPERAAAIANSHVVELRRLTSQLALTDAQQRRAFFEGHLKKTRDDLAAAQLKLQDSGFNPGALKAEPKAAAENYAKLKAEATAAEVRLQTMRRNLSDETPEVQLTLATLGALRAQLAKSETATNFAGGPDYIGKYREFKYQETLFEMTARQYELARVDESREGALIQVVDVAKPPERKSRPKRALIAIMATLGSLPLLAIFVVWRHLLRQSLLHPLRAAKMAQLRSILK